MEMEVEGCLASYVDRGSVDSHRYFLARRTLLEMLRDRGYPVPEADLHQTVSGFRSQYGEAPELDRLTISSTIPSNGPERPNKVLVLFCGTDPVKLSTVREIYSRVNKESLTRLILVLQSKMTSKARDAMKEIFAFKVEIFQITDLLVNITNHTLMPRHEKLTAAEKQKLLKKYNLEDSQLPRMLESDAVARYYGYEKGQVVKVTYDGELTGSHVTYRCVM